MDCLLHMASLFHIWLVYNIYGQFITCMTSLTSLVLLLLVLLTVVRNARQGESANTLSVRRPQPHTTNPWKEEKDKIVGEKKSRSNQQESIGSAL